MTGDTVESFRGYVTTMRSIVGIRLRISQWTGNHGYCRAATSGNDVNANTGSGVCSRASLRTVSPDWDALRKGVAPSS